MEHKPNTSKIKLIFAGTSYYAKNVLEQIITDKKINVVGVFCQKPNKYTINYVYDFAHANKLEVFTPDDINDINTKELLTNLGADILITCAYGQFIDGEILKMFKHKAFNVHASLLPKYRGGNPIQQAIMDGEKETGVSFIEMTKGMDQGDIYFFSKVEITDTDQFLDIETKLITKTNEFICKWIIAIIENRIHPHSQVELKKPISYAYHLKPNDYYLDFDTSVKQIYNKIRSARPGEEFKFKKNNVEFKVFKAFYELVEDKLAPKTIVVLKSALKIKAKDGYVCLLEIQQQSKKRLTIKQFLAGNQIFKNGDDCV